MSWASERARFPVLREHAYLNAGTFGPLSDSTLATMRELRDWEAAHGRGGKAYFEEMLDARERVRVLLAAQIGVPPECVALTESTTQGVHIVVMGLGLGAADEVVTTDAEHFGLTGPLVASGATLKVARVRGGTAADVFELIRREVTPQTRLIATSAISWIDGTVFPWGALREETGVPVLVDGAQSVGAVAVDATAADFYTVSAQKWLCGPDGTGALYVRDPEALRPRLVSYPSQAEYDIAAATWVPKAGAARFDPVFAAATSIAGLEDALTALPVGRFARARELSALFHERLLAAGFDVVSEAGQGPLVSFRVHGDPADTVESLYDRGVVLRELPSMGLLRASVGWWNDESDLERLLDGLSAG